MRRRLLVNCTLLDPERAAPEPGALLLVGDRIGARLAPDDPRPDAEVVDLGGLAVAPGFIDLHYHGRFVFDSPDVYAETLARSGRTLLAHGTTAYLPTTIAWPHEHLLERVGALTRVIGEAPSGTAHALGLHLEGPWIRPEAAGAQPRSGIHAYRTEEGSELFARSEGLVKMVTFAPEAEGADVLEAALARLGILGALGHSLADDACVMAAVERGVARHVTHLFNAMGGVHHRERGLAGVALSEDRLTCDVICDGVHVHPAIVRLAARAKGERLVLISDRVEPGPADDFGAGAIEDDGRALRLADGTLAGSSLTLDRAVANAIEWGALSRLEAVSAVTLRPARQLGIEATHGTLRTGARADLALFDTQGRLQSTWIGGDRVWEAGQGVPA